MNLTFIQGYSFTVFVETILLALLLRKFYPIKTIIINSLIANTITLPFVWLVFPNLPVTYTIQVFISEMFAFIVEALIYFKLFAKMPLQCAIIVSFICNLCSFLGGLVLLFYF